MKKFKRILIWCTVIIIVLLSATYFFAPKLINSELLKGKIESIASQKVKGDVQFQSLDLSLFPRPHATIHQGSISTTEAIGTIGSLSIYPEILPLLRGKLQIRKLLVKSPDIQMSLSPEAKKTPTTGTFPLKAIGKKVATFLAAPLVLDHPDLVVVMENGNLNIIKESVSVFSMENIDSEVVFPPKGLTVIKAKIASSIFKLSVQHDNKDLVIKGSSLKGRVYHDNDKTSISFSELIFDYPRLKLAGSLYSENNSQSVSLSLGGQQVDAESVREVALALAGNIPVTQEIFKIVKGGNIPSITFDSKASSFAGLKKLKNIVIKGSMSEGEIFVPKANLDLKAVKGDFVISQGILKAENLEAQLQNSYGQEGTLEIGLNGKGIPFHLDIMVQAELAELHPLLKRLIKNKAFVEKLALINDPIGKASGRLVLGESLKSLKARVEVSDVNLSAHYNRYPIKISSGSFYYDQTRISLKNLRGEVGKSFFSDLTFQLGLLKEPYFDISSGKASIFIDETHSLIIKNISSDAEKTLPVAISADMTLGQSDITLKGNVDVINERLIFDIDLSTGKLEWDILKDIFASEQEDKDKKHFYDFPMKGLVKLKSESFAYDKFIWKPFNADIAIDRDNINIAVIESDLCGISFPGKFEITPRQMSLGFEPVANDKDLESSMACLFGIKKRSTGSFDLQGKFTGEGKGEDILNSLTGNLEFTAENGRIYKGGVLAKILAFINITEIFRGKMPDLVQEGFAYNSITADGELHGGILTLKEIIIDSSSMKIVSHGDINIKDKKLDIEVLVAPLKTVDSIVEKIPLIKDLTKGTLISIPLKVTGDLDDPKITYFSSSSDGSGLTGIMMKTLKFPMKIIKPIISGEKEKE